MMPVCTYLDSYPPQRNQTGYRTFPTYMPFDPPKSPMVYESWPNGGSYGYPMPSRYSCCNHGNFPDFRTFGPSHLQPMASPVPCFGGYPMPYPEAYPVCYVPPPHCSAELPRYEFGENMLGRHHCCECPHHRCHQKGDESLRIEEQEPDLVEKKGNDSLTPIQTRNYPYPVVWIPLEHEKEQRRPFEPKVDEQESFPHKLNEAESKNFHDQEPKIWNGWYPLDAEKIKYLTKGGDGKRTQDQKNEEQRKYFQFPVIWMPCYDGRREDGGKKENKDVNGGRDLKNEDQMRQFPFPIVWLPPQDNKKEECKGENGKEANASSNFTESPPYTLKLLPMMHLDGANNVEKSHVNNGNPAGKNDTEVKGKTATRKNIPVKHVDSYEEKSEDREKKDRIVHVKRMEDAIPVKAAETNGKQSTSSPKSSKLPPVCLRVDSLPKKKNGSSRSPSPPGVKERSQQNSVDTTKASIQSKENTKQVSIESTPGNNKDVEAKKKEAKEFVMTEKTSDGPQVSVHSAMHPNAGISEKPTEEKTTETKEATELAKSGDEMKLEKKTLSDVEAAMRIQSALRGFDMRRSEPLKKLKQIAEVREQVADVRNRIQSVESSYDVQKDDKQKLLIGETIMRLLLKLDTIQGLHPSLRDIRKSLAKELVTLQEKLDSLVINKLEQSKVEECPVESLETKTNKCMLKQEKQEDTGGSGSSDMMQSGGDKLLPMMGSEDISAGEEALLSPSDNFPQLIVSEGVGQEVHVESDLKPKEPDSEAVVEHEDEVRNGVPDTCAVKILVAEDVNNAPQLKQAGEVPAKEDENESDMLANSFKAIDGTHAGDSLETILDELPINAIDDEHIELERDKQAEIDNTTAFGTRSSEGALLGDTKELMATQEEVEMNDLAELPIGAIDEDSASAEVEKNGNPLGKESECRSTIETTLPEEKTPNENGKPEEALEETPIAETEECVEVESEENQMIPVASMLEVGTEQKNEREVGEHDEHSFFSKLDGLQSVISMADKQCQNVLPEDACISAEAARNKELPMELNEEARHFPFVTAEEVKELQEMNVQSTNLMNDKLDGLEVINEEVSAWTELTPFHLQAEISTDEREMQSKGDKQLMEENEKLRETMEKLIEAGKQQLNVISNLNGRVKDLEKKLSRTRKLRTKQMKLNKASACGASRLKRLNVPAKDGAVGVAM